MHGSRSWTQAAHGASMLMLLLEEELELELGLVRPGASVEVLVLELLLLLPLPLPLARRIQRILRVLQRSQDVLVRCRSESGTRRFCFLSGGGGSISQRHTTRIYRRENGIREMIRISVKGEDAAGRLGPAVTEVCRRPRFPSLFSDRISSNRCQVLCRSHSLP